MSTAGADDISNAPALEGGVPSDPTATAGLTSSSWEQGLEGAWSSATCWWKYVATGPGALTASMVGSTGDPIMFIYEGDDPAAGLRLVASSDDAQGLIPVATFPVSPEKTYWIRVGFYSAGSLVVTATLANLEGGDALQLPPMENIRYSSDGSTLVGFDTSPGLDGQFPNLGTVRVMRRSGAGFLDLGTIDLGTISGKTVHPTFMRFIFDDLLMVHATFTQVASGQYYYEGDRNFTYFVKFAGDTFTVNQYELMPGSGYSNHSVDLQLSGTSARVIGQRIPISGTSLTNAQAQLYTVDFTLAADGTVSGISENFLIGPSSDYSGALSYGTMRFLGNGDIFCTSTTSTNYVISMDGTRSATWSRTTSPMVNTYPSKVFTIVGTTIWAIGYTGANSDIPCTYSLDAYTGAMAGPFALSDVPQSSNGSWYVWDEPVLGALAALWDTGTWSGTANYVVVVDFRSGSPVLVSADMLAKWNTWSFYGREMSAAGDPTALQAAVRVRSYDSAVQDDDHGFVTYPKYVAPVIEWVDDGVRRIFA